MACDEREQGAACLQAGDSQAHVPTPPAGPYLHMLHAWGPIRCRQLWGGMGFRRGELLV